MARVASVENLRHDFVAKIQGVAFDPRLLRGDRQPHELGAAREFVSELTKFRDLVKLALRGLLVDKLKNHACGYQKLRKAVKSLEFCNSPP